MKKLVPLIISFVTIMTFMILSINASANDNHNYDNEINQIYKEGKDKGIIHDIDLTHKEFVNLMKNSVIPAYKNFSKAINDRYPNYPKMSLEQYTAEDNYEIPFISPNDNPTIVSASGKGKHPFAYLMYGEKLKVISNQINVYKDKSFKHKTHIRLKKNTIIKGKFVRYGEITRFKVDQGYVTSNTNFIKRIFK